MNAAPPGRVLLGVTGSIAAALTPGIAIGIQAIWGAQVRVVLSNAARQFVTPRSLAVICRHQVAGDTDGKSEVVTHHELARWADLILVAPTTANTLASIAQGAASNLLTTTVLAATSPVVLVPSMNASMWFKPAVQRNVAAIQADGIGVMPPARGLAAVDRAAGIGAMPPLDQVLTWTFEWLQTHQSAEQRDEVDCVV